MSEETPIAEECREFTGHRKCVCTFSVAPTAGESTWLTVCAFHSVQLDKKTALLRTERDQLKAALREVLSSLQGCGKANEKTINRTRDERDRLRAENAELRKRITWLDEVTDEAVRSLEAYGRAFSIPEIRGNATQLRTMIGESRVAFNAALAAHAPAPVPEGQPDISRAASAPGSTPPEAHVPEGRRNSESRES